ncbi:hypothetical protein [Halomonas cerina]|uniref:Uncharacterized protein n=1 Tax=Halomonas cerina TaxID=447424 RepID=A0A839V261_9GAMM|nr:hypothetical protein [Halomonas cerina]MBB3189793.1 hypothetical protein [Halomonas cerina]
MTLAHAIGASLLGLGLLGLPLSALAQQTDPDTGLVMAEGWQTVRNNCTACHSANLVTQNSGSRNHWEKLIRWMQDTQGLWQFQPETEATILDYLAKHYGPKEGARRPPLPRHLMPDNPYSTIAESG